MEACHDDPVAGHLGLLNTLMRVRSRYLWNGMYRIISSYVASCLQCQQRKLPSELPAGTPHPLPSPRRLFYQGEVNILGLFLESAYGKK